MNLVTDDFQSVERTEVCIVQVRRREVIPRTNKKTTIAQLAAQDHIPWIRRTTWPSASTGADQVQGRSA